MARLAKLVAALALGVGSISAFAGYAQLTPPERFSGSPGDWKFAPSANDAKYGRAVFQPNALKVPGTTVTMPAAYRFAANAPKVAAAAIYLSPHLRTAIGIATLLGVTKVFWDEAEKVWKQNVDTETVFDLYKYTFGGAPQIYDSAQEACYAVWLKIAGGGKVFVGTSVSGLTCTVTFSYPYERFGVPANTPQDQQANLERVDAPCPANTIKTPAGCLMKSSRTDIIETVEDFQQRVINPAKNPGWPNVPADWPMPETVPLELPPGTPLPVDPPVVNPNPGPNPTPQPKFIPTGDPVPNPNYDPQKAPGPDNQPWFQPGMRVTPSPTANEPWRVDIVPVNRPQPTADPLPDTPETPQPEDKPKPEERQSLCEKHPDIAACAKMDEVNPDTVKNESKTISITPKTGWGSDNAACPAPKVIAIANTNAEFSYQPICDLAAGLRPIVIALAWLSAATMVITAARRSS